MNPCNNSAVIELIMNLGSKARGVYLNPPCDEKTIEQMQADAKRALGEEVPVEYANLLRRSNGIQINGAYFKKAEYLVAENLDVFREEVIVLGVEGNMAEFVYDKRDRRFHMINLGFPDERFSSFDTLDEMLAQVLKEQQIVKD